MNNKKIFEFEFEITWLIDFVIVRKMDSHRFFEIHYPFQITLIRCVFLAAFRWMDTLLSFQLIYTTINYTYPLIELRPYLLPSFGSTYRLKKAALTWWFQSLTCACSGNNRLQKDRSPTCRTLTFLDFYIFLKNNQQN